MRNSYVEFQEQTDSRIELAKSWQRKGFYFFATSTIIQAFEVVDKFEERLRGLENGYYYPFDFICNPNKYDKAIIFTKVFSQASRNNLDWAVRAIERTG
jgi:hypothetical protein